MLRFLVVGTGRCGLGYTAQVLTRMGIPCGLHWTQGTGPRKYPQIEIQGDASALAVPALPGFGGLVLHQVRDPVRMIGSYLGTGLLRDVASRGPDGALFAEHFPIYNYELGDAMRLYLAWNARCERHDRYFRYRVEDLDLGLFRRIAELIGADVEDAAILRAIDRVPRDFNTRFNHRPITWADMPECWAKDDLAKLAARYGYPAADAPVAPRAQEQGIST